MQVQAGRDGSFHKWLAQAVLTEDDQWNGALNAGAAPRFFSHGIAGSIHHRRLAHVCTRKIPTPQMLAEARLIVDICMEIRTSRNSSGHTGCRRSRTLRHQPTPERVSGLVSNGAATLAIGCITAGNVQHGEVKFIFLFNQHGEAAICGK
jgi:hypothetical protein